jgi:hypothetical protein
MIEVKEFRTFISIYSIFKSVSISANYKLTFHKALVRSVLYVVAVTRIMANEATRISEAVVEPN